MEHWVVKFRYIKAKDTYHLYRFEDGRWHFLYDFKRCDNLLMFIAILKKANITFEWRK